MKKTLNKYKILLILAIIIFCLISAHYSVDAIDFGQADDFLEAGKANQQIQDLKTIGNEFSTIGSVLTYIGAGILVGATAYMGILYIVSSPEKQAKLKGQLIGLVVSAVVIFGAYGIWSMLVHVLESTMG